MPREEVALRACVMVSLSMPVSLAKQQAPSAKLLLSSHLFEAVAAPDS